MRRKRIFLWIISIAYIFFIFSNSLADGETSGDLSAAVTEIVLHYLDRAGFAVSFDVFHHFIRKSAHFIEYLILGAMIVWSEYECPLSRRHWHVILLLMVLVPSCDETIQHFTPERYGAVTDVILDMSGYLAGAANMHLRLRKKDDA